MAEAKPHGQRHATDLIRGHPVAFACLVALLWLVPGLVGHDPWRPEETQTFGIVYDTLYTGEWVVPRIAGVPSVKQPPLASVSAAITAILFAPVLALHDGARLATGLYMALALLLVGATARELLGPGRGWLAALSLLGSIGLIWPGHFLNPDVPQLTGFALALFGLALALRRPVWGGLALGTGLGVAFLSKGFFGPACLVLAAAALPVLSPAWRSRRYAVAVVLAAVAAMPWLLIWPALLAQRAPDVFHAWFWTDNIARLAGDDPLWPPESPGYYLVVLPWFAFPALPLALWGVWAERSKLREPRLLLPLVMTGATVLVLSIAGSPREVYAMPVLAPLAVLSVVGLLQMPRSPSNGFWWFSGLFASFIIVMGWFEWIALEVGIPEARNRHWLRLQPGYESHVDPLVLLAALALTALWAWLLLRLRRSPERPLVVWAAGIALIWAIAAIMFMDYVDAGKTYRRVMTSLARELPAGYDCVSSYNLGDVQRGMLHYFAGVRSYREGVPGESRECSLLLVQGARANMYVPGPEWTQLWEGSRRGELFRLYRRS
jgi:4-amino-4-deoxy-L-arabinose transferase-like glycosyltransferase